VLQRILGIARDYFHLQNVAILLLDKEPQRLCVRSQIGWDAGEDKISLGFGEALRELRSEEATGLRPGCQRDSRYICSAKSTRSELAIP